MGDGEQLRCPYGASTRRKWQRRTIRHLGCVSNIFNLEGKLEFVKPNNHQEIWRFEGMFN